MNRETIEKAAYNYTLNDKKCVKDFYELNAKDEIIRTAFVAGANWRINSVWHEGNEVPEANKRTLVCFEEVIGEFIYYRIRAFKPNVIKNWGKDNSCLDKVICWAYLNDLLPERKEDE